MNPRNHIWAITPEGLEQLEKYSSISLIEKLKGAVPVQEQPFKAAAMYEDVPGKSRKNGTSSTVRIIPIEGVMVKKKSFEMMLMEYFFGIKSNTTRDVIKALQEADKDESINAIVLVADTPGGTVDGTQSLASSIAACSKPVVGFIDGMCASAGYYALSQCQEIIAEEPDSLVGSIGTVMQFFNYAGYLDQEGQKMVKITADSSPDKNNLPNAYEEVTEAQISEAKAILNPANQRFINTVKAGRAKIKAEHLTGKVYAASEVVGSLIDQIGGLSVAVDRAAYLASKQNSSTQKKEKTTMEQTEASVLREVMQATIDDLKGQLSAKETAFAEKESTTTELAAKVSQLEGEKAALAAQVAEKETEVQALTEKLEKTPADQVTAVNAREMFASGESDQPWLKAPWNAEAAKQAKAMANPFAAK
jgi:signal peptide peptidase SppA